MDNKFCCVGALLVLASLCSVATSDPVRQLRYPRIYNAYITTNKELQPSKAYPHSAPVLQPALYGPALFGPGLFPAPALYAAPPDAVQQASRDVELRLQDADQPAGVEHLEEERNTEAVEAQSAQIPEQQPQRQEQEPQRQEEEPQRQEQESQRQEQEPQRQEQEPQRQEQEPQRQEQDLQRQEQEPQRQEQEAQRQVQELERQEQEPQRPEANNQGPDVDAQLPEEQPQTSETEPQILMTEGQTSETEPDTTKTFGEPSISITGEKIYPSARMSPLESRAASPKAMSRANQPLTFYPRSIGYYPHPFIPYSYPLAPQPFVFGGVSPGLGAPNAIYNYPTQIAGNNRYPQPSSIYVNDRQPMSYKATHQSSVELNTGGVMGKQNTDEQMPSAENTDTEGDYDNTYDTE